MDEIERIKNSIASVEKQLDKIKWNCNHKQYAALMERREELIGWKKRLIAGSRIPT